MESQETTRPSCYIEFRVNDKTRFEIFQRFFNAMRTWTRQRSIGHPDHSHAATTVANDATFKAKHYEKDEDWLLTFRPPDLAYLNMPDHRESITRARKWREMNRKERRADINKEPPLQTLADFVDMVRKFKNVEFELVGCEKVASDTARLEFQVFTYPFEGKIALEDMLLFFGFFSIIDNTC